MLIQYFIRLRRGRSFWLTCFLGTALSLAFTSSSFANSDKDLWFELSTQLTLEQSNQARIHREMQWLKKNPGYINTISQRAKPYIFHVYQAVQRRDMPLEITLLPIVESGYDAFAYSPGRAAGLWQFIPATGKHYGLTQNWWYDGRRDIVASTEAALDYLNTLHKRFNKDWLLALAAYNVGQGNVSKAIRNNKRAGKPTDFWSLKLPQETRRYVPRLLAVAKAIRQPGQYGFNLSPIPNEPQFDIVNIGSQIDLAQAASMAGIDMKTLYQYNPAFNQWATPPNGPHRLLIPRNASARFETALAKLPKHERVTWQRYTVKPGDSLSEIAEKFRSTTQQLKNSNQLSNDRIRIGQALMIAVASADNAHYVLSAQQRQAKFLKHSGSIYRIKAGDSWWKIGKAHGLSAATLARNNGKSPRDTLRIGQKIIIPGGTKTSMPASHERSAVMRNVAYHVKSGDSLSRIAQRFNVSVGDIVALNRLDPNKYLRPGQKLRIKVNVTHATTDSVVTTL